MIIALKPDWTAPAEPFRHTWTGVVNIDQFRWLVRRDTQEQLAMAVAELGARHVRAVGIFDDEMRFFTLTPSDWKDKERQPKINFQLIDYVIDSLQDLGLAPMITTCFMPSALAAGDKTVFTTKGRISLPKDWKKWEGLIQNTVQHCVERYGLEVVREWYFEVWNEPNLKDNFFEGTYEDFLTLWHSTYTAIKSVDSQLRVGPSTTTARAEWVEPFLIWTRKTHCEPDYMILHIYNNDSEFAALSPFEGPQDDRTVKSPNYASRVIAGARSLLDRLGYKGEIHWNEWGRTWHPTDLLRETPVEAAWIVKTMAEVSQQADYFAYWCLSDIYDQVGYVSAAFEQHYGMLNVQGLRKPSWHAHQLLSRLGTARYPVTIDGNAEIGAIATRKGKRNTILLYGFNATPSSHEIRISFPAESAGKRLTLTSINSRDNNIITRWKELGSPAYLTRKQVSELQAANELTERPEHPAINSSPNGAEAIIPFENPGVLLLEW